MNNINSEQWKELAIPNIDSSEMYLISDYGRVKRKKTNYEWTIITPSKIKGYSIINIKLDNGKRTTRYIHKLVANCFLMKEHHEQDAVIHLDFNKENNHVRNLKWVDHEGLFTHQAKNPNYKKGVIRYSKLTETDVIRLKKKIQRGKNPLYKIAKEFGITHTQLNRIRSGENWGHIKVD